MTNETETTTPFIAIAVGSKNPSKIQSVRQALEQISLSHNAKDQNQIKLVLVGYDVASGVADQPYGDEMTRKGAQTRARAAFEAYANDHSGCEPHLAVGMEGGLEEITLTNSNDADESHNPAANNNNVNLNSVRSYGGVVDPTSSLACMAWMAVYGKRTSQVLSWTCQVPISRDEISIVPYSWGIAKTASFFLPPKITQLLRENGMELGDADDVVFSRNNSKHGSGTVGILTNGLIDRSKYYEHALILALVSWIRPDVYP